MSDHDDWIETINAIGDSLSRGLKKRPFEMYKVYFKKSELVEVLAKYADTDKDIVEAEIDILIKLGVISANVFMDESDDS